MELQVKALLAVVPHRSNGFRGEENYNLFVCSAPFQLIKSLSTEVLAGVCALAWIKP